jgi:hypothetical protein
MSGRDSELRHTSIFSRDILPVLPEKAKLKS